MCFSSKFTAQAVFSGLYQAEITPDDPRILPSLILYNESSVLITARVPLAATTAQVPPPCLEDG